MVILTSLLRLAGFIGLDSHKNEASITMGFHGDGWPKSGEGSRKYQTGIYADVAKSHNQEHTTTPVSIADQFNTYGLLWTKSRVVWTFNGAVVRSVDDPSIIPAIKMAPRLHSRSGFCNKMSVNGSFVAQFLSFSYEPVK